MQHILLGRKYSFHQVSSSFAHLPNWWLRPRCHIKWAASVRWMISFESHYIKCNVMSEARVIMTLAINGRRLPYCYSCILGFLAYSLGLSMGLYPFINVSLHTLHWPFFSPLGQARKPLDPL